MELYQINFVDGIPVYRQLVDRIRANIKGGIMENGMQLPTVRELAQQLGVALGTVKRAYDELEREGFLYTVPAKGSFVAPKNVELLREERLRRLEEHLRQATLLATECGLSREELRDALELIWEETK